MDPSRQSISGRVSISSTIKSFGSQISLFKIETTWLYSVTLAFCKRSWTITCTYWPKKFRSKELSTYLLGGGVGSPGRCDRKITIFFRFRRLRLRLYFPTGFWLEWLLVYYCVESERSLWEKRLNPSSSSLEFGTAFSIPIWNFSSSLRSMVFCPSEPISRAS